MHRLEWLASALAVGGLLVSAWPDGPRPLTHHAASWHNPPRPAARCGAALTIVAALVDPRHVPDRDGELVRMRNLEPEPLDLSGWTLVRGRARRPLDDLVVPAGGAIELVGRELGAIRLPNRGGAVAVEDPCGIRTTFAWPPLAPGELALEPIEALGAM